jgi:hypothetical protein
MAVVNKKDITGIAFSIDSASGINLPSAYSVIGTYGPVKVQGQCAMPID